MQEITAHDAIVLAFDCRLTVLGLSKVDVAYLASVTRMTLYRWLQAGPEHLPQLAAIVWTRPERLVVHPPCRELFEPPPLGWRDVVWLMMAQVKQGSRETIPTLAELEAELATRHEVTP